MESTKEKVINFSHYKPINKNQEEFHKSTATNKLLIGPYRSGKTYAAIYEALFICDDNPGHEFGIFRNTIKSLEGNIQKDFLAVAEKCNAIKTWKKSEGILTLWNGTKVIFLPLSTSRAQLKGMNMCGFIIDDPDTVKYKEAISFLFTRLTNPPGVEAKYFATIICANYEGHDWLWQMYMRRRDPSGDGMFAYWFCVTKDNTTLSRDYIEIQAALHSESWMKRYIYGDREGYAGLVFAEYEPKWHDADLSWCFSDHSLIKEPVIDLGITHPSVILSVGTDHQNIYFYDEWYKVNQRTQDVGHHLLGKYTGREKFRRPLIDPKSCAKEQTSGTSPRKILKNDFGIKNIKLANNNVRYGIEVMKGIMTLRQDPNDPENKITHFFIDPIRCPNLVRELETLKWKEPQYSDFDELAWKEEPIDKDNDATDCARYACVDLKPYLTSMRLAERQDGQLRLKRWEEKFSKLPLYQNKNHPGSVEKSRAQMIRDIHYGRQKEMRKMLTN